MSTWPDTLAAHPDLDALVADQVATVDRFRHLARARILAFLSQRQPMLHGSPCLAYICRPELRGQTAALYFEWLHARALPPEWRGDCDFVIIVDGALWPGWTLEERQRVVYHELRHIEQAEDEWGAPRFHRVTGRPVYRLVRHDGEFFADELERYGPTLCAAERIAVAIARGYRAEQARTRASDAA